MPRDNRFQQQFEGLQPQNALPEEMFDLVSGRPKGSVNRCHCVRRLGSSGFFVNVKVRKLVSGALARFRMPDKNRVPEQLKPAVHELKLFARNEARLQCRLIGLPPNGLLPRALHGIKAVRLHVLTTVSGRIVVRAGHVNPHSSEPTGIAAAYRRSHTVTTASVSRPEGSGAAVWSARQRLYARA
ncbi:hypothetical protein [Rhodobacter sp. CZR27]|uniref:hypothetical protein n=1 Tax=Rhodobacter sp. CZR27 TaxID=2033869 RepID=UPI0018E0A53F|nr:hypothetical protein [Rhodobacter sp. CZR27]